MKNIIIFASLIMTLLLQVSCSSDDKKSVEQPNYPTYDTPKWSVANSNTYEHSMSAIVMLPSALQPYENDNDELAIFCGDECRGTAERIKVNSQTSVWMMLIYGTDNNNEMLYFKYYSSNEKMMYKDTSHINFENDEKYGTFDDPFILSLEKMISTDE